MASIDILSCNPERPPDWRWLRAQEIIDGTGLRASRRRDGCVGHKWINRLTNFCRARRRCTTDHDVILLADKYKEIFWAYRLWDISSPQRHSIEARILARQTDHEIAYRTNFTPKIINAYEHIFFNVRQKLEHKSYILNCVMGPAIHRGLLAREYDLLWKLYGYFLGPHLIDTLESGFSNPIWCGTADALAAAIQDDVVSTLKMRAAVAVKTVPINSFTQLPLIEQFTKYVDVERNNDGGGKAQEQILDHIAAMMVALPLNVGGRAPKGNAIMNPRIQEFERTAIELTYEETMRLSVNQPIANPNLLKMLEFPKTQSTQLLEGPNT